MNDSACHVCEMLLEHSEPIYSDGVWTARALADVPGWVVLLTDRHSNDWLWGLNDRETSGFGSLVQRISAALRATTECDFVHFIALGENSPHFHCALLSRSSNSAIGGLELLKNRDQLLDAKGARDSETKLRDWLAAN